MRINPIKGLSVAPVRSTGVASKPAPPAEPQDQASIGLNPAPARPVGRLSNKLLEVARGLTLGVALLGGVLGAVGVVSFATSQPGQATEKLLSADKNLTADQRRLASAEMTPMGDKTLRWLGASGERIYITETDDQVVEMYQQLGKLHPLEPSKITAQGIKLRTALEQARQQPEWQSVQQHRDSLTAQASQLRQQWMGDSKPIAGGFGMLGSASGSPPPPELLALSKEQLQVQLQLEKLQTEAIQKSGVDTQTVRPGTGTLEGLLTTARAKTPEQRQEYLQLLSAINGGALESQQAEALQRQQTLVAQMPPGPLRDMCEQMLHSPDKLVLGMETPLLIPQFCYYQVHDQTVRVQKDDPVIGKVDALGLHFGGRGIIQVDADQVGGQTHVINHELGHSMDDLLSQQNPQFHKKWSAQVKEALEEARQRNQEGKPVASQYSLTNEAEYVAEGVEYYFENPEMLKANDPKLFALTEQLLHRADEQGKLNLKESLALMAGAGLLGLAFALTGRRQRP